MAVIEAIKQDLRSSQWNVSTGDRIGQTFNSGNLNNIAGVSFYQQNNNYTGSYGIEFKLYEGIGGELLYTEQKNIPQNNGGGWKTINFPEPLQIKANTVYFINFKVTSGFWAGAPYRTGDVYVDGVMTYNENPYTDGKDTMFIIWSDDENVVLLTAFFTETECAGTYTEFGNVIDGDEDPDTGNLWSHITGINWVKDNNTVLVISQKYTFISV